MNKQQSGSVPVRQTQSTTRHRHCEAQSKLDPNFYPWSGALAAIIRIRAEAGAPYTHKHSNKPRLSIRRRSGIDGAFPPLKKGGEGGFECRTDTKIPLGVRGGVNML